MYYILYKLNNLKVIHTDTKPLKPQDWKVYGKAEYKGELPKGDWLSVSNVHEEVETWRKKIFDEEAQQEVEIEKSKTHMVCDLVAHFYTKIESSEKQLAAIRIKALKKLLDDTDYQAVKYAEGWLTAEEYEPIKMQRQAWRDEINQLEKSKT